MPAKVPVLLDRPLHKKLKDRLKGIAQITSVINRLVEMYLNGEIKVTLPEKQL